MSWMVLLHNSMHLHNKHTAWSLFIMFIDAPPRYMKENNWSISTCSTWKTFHFCDTSPLLQCMSSDFKVKYVVQGHLAIHDINLDSYILLYIFIKVASIFQYKSAHWRFLWYTDTSSLSATWCLPGGSFERWCSVLEAQMPTLTI